MFQENRHSIVIKSDPHSVRSEIVRWGEAPWWPEKSLMRFVRTTPRPVQRGTRYRQEVLFLFAPTWEVEVESVTDTGITRRFVSGMFKGFETVDFRLQRDAVEVHYRMHYEVQGLINRFLWLLFFRNLHDSNIEEILAHLKTFCEHKMGTGEPE
jgi:hypothetical protein